MNWWSDEVRQAVLLSLQVAFWATLFAMPVAIWVAHLLARKRFWGRGLLNALVHLPLIMPPVVTGYFLLNIFGTKGVVGAWLADIGIVFAFDWTGAALAAAVMAFPLMVRAVRLSMEAVDEGLAEAASTLGATPMAIFWRVRLPLALPGIMTGAMLGFAKSMGEFGATITFVSNIPGETQTIASAIYTFLQVPGGDGAAMGLALLSVGVSLLALLGSEYLADRMALHKVRS
jgi:molybdate ABC transporter, permease protein